MPAPRRFAVLGIVAALAATGPGCNEGDVVTAPALSATCSATPSSGEAPLVVSFALTIAGAEGAPSVAVSYGDGTSGTNPDATHTYSAGGVYTASFTVTTSTDQTARCAATVTVSGDATPVPDPSPAPGGNLPPVADFRTGPGANDNDRIVGTAPLDVTFNMCRTSDPEGDTLYFTMDLDGDGKIDVRGSTGASCREDWTYTTMGTWKASNCVTDLDPLGARLHDFQCVTYTVVAN